MKTTISPGTNSGPRKKTVGAVAAAVAVVLAGSLLTIVGGASAQGACPPLVNPTDVLQACHMPGENLRWHIEKALGKRPGAIDAGNITLGNVQGITQLDASALCHHVKRRTYNYDLDRTWQLCTRSSDGPIIENATGIGLATGLTNLNLQAHEITSLDLTNNTNLRDLTLRSSYELTSLTLPVPVAPAVSELKNITFDRAPDITSFAIPALSKLESITIRDSAMTVTFPANAATDLPKLKSIVFTDVEMSSLDLPAFTDLENFQLSNGGLDTFTFPTSLTKMKSLRMDNNNLTTFPAIPDTWDLLETVDLTHNEITGITSAIVAGSPVFSNTITGLAKLKDLKLYNNKFTTLLLGDLPELTRLWLASNKLGGSYDDDSDDMTPEIGALSGVDATNTPKLESLWVQWNTGLTFLDLSTLTKIKTVRVSATALSSIDISAVPAGPSGNRNKVTLVMQYYPCGVQRDPTRPNPSPQSEIERHDASLSLSSNRSFATNVNVALDRSKCIGRNGMWPLAGGI